MRPILASLLVPFAFATVSAAPLRPSAPARAFVPGEVLVALAAPAAGSPGANDDALAATIAGLGLDRAGSLAAAGGVRSQGLDVVRFTSARADFDPYAAAAALRVQPGVLGAAPNLLMRLHVVPNDPWLPNQWPFNNSAAAIHAPAGWNHGTGSPGVKIAILDTGVDLGHEDLASKIWTNTAEIPGNGVDDDSDGYVDDVHGWDFGDHDNDPNPVPIFDAVYGIDEGWHGTFVAGLAAAATNNAIGAAGVAWDCPVMPLKVTDSLGEISMASMASAIDYAIAHGASVINMSLGTNDPSAASLFQPLVTAAFDAGVVCVASAGNSGTDELNWPAACDSVISVASTNVSNVRSDWSNWGPSVDVCAPGEATWSCIARNYEYDETTLIFFEVLWFYDDVHPYMQNDGTSFSAPLVSGAAALLRSQVGGLGPQQVRDRIVADGDVKLYDNPIGPKLNLDRLLSHPLAVAPDAGAPLSFGAPSPNPASRAASLAYTLPAPVRVRLAILDAAGRRVRVLAEGERPAGAQSASWDLCDAAGAPVPAGLYFARLEAGGRAEVRRIAVIR